jgi:hypothetical protein
MDKSERSSRRECADLCICGGPMKTPRGGWVRPEAVWPVGRRDAGNLIFSSPQTAPLAAAPRLASFISSAPAG